MFGPVSSAEQSALVVEGDVHYGLGNAAADVRLPVRVAVVPARVVPGDVATSALALDVHPVTTRGKVTAATAEGHVVVLGADAARNGRTML